MLRKSITYALFGMVLLFVSGCQQQPTFYESVESIPVSLEPADGVQDILEAGPNSFDRHFTKTRVIALSDEVILGDIGKVEIGPTGQILVIERGDQHAYLFDSDGNLLNVLDPDSCHPGFTWRPSKAAFRSDGSFLVFNNASGGFYFNGNGECLYPYDVERFPPVQFAFDDLNKDVLMLVKRSDKLSVIRTDSIGVKESVVFSSTFPVALHRLGFSGLALDNEGNTIHYYPHSPFLYRLSKEGTGYEKLGTSPPSYMPIPKDFTIEESADTEQWIKRFNEWFSSYSIGNGFYDIGDGKLLLLHHNGYVSDRRSPETIGLHVVDFEGHSIFGEEIFAGDKQIIAAGNGAIYGQGKAASDLGEQMNPTLIEYKLNRE